MPETDPVGKVRLSAAWAIGLVVLLNIQPGTSLPAQERDEGEHPRQGDDRQLSSLEASDVTLAIQRRLDEARGGGVVSLKAGTHVTGPLRVPAGVKLMGEPGAVLKLRNGVVNPNRGTALVSLDSEAVVESLTLDGNADGNPANPGPAYGTALIWLADGGRFNRVAHCTLRDAALFGIYANGSTDATLTGNRFVGVRSAGVILQNASHRPMIAGNRFLLCRGSGIKLDAGDGAHRHATLEAPVVCDNWVDYRGVTTRPETLGIEFWTETGGDPGVIGGVIRGNTIWGPTGPGASLIFGISLGGCSDSRCTENLVHGPNLDIGIETANAIRPVVSGNVIEEARIGWSASQLCRQPSFIGNKVRRCSQFGAQLIDRTTEAVIQSNTWVDAGADRMLFLNNAGRNSNIQGNTFLLEDAPAAGSSIAAFYSFGSASRGTLFKGNVCRPVPEGSSDSGLVGAYLNSASGVTVEGNDFDTTAPSGRSNRQDAVVVAGDRKPNIIRNNTVRTRAANSSGRD